MPTTNFSARTFGLLAAAAAVLVVLVFTQLHQPGQQDATLPSVGPVTDVSDAQLRKVVLIVNEVERIQIALRQQMLEAPDPDTQRQLQREADAQITEAIRQNNMEVEEYSLIARSLNDDAELFERFQEIQRE
jgi:hypothetical protein